jgi:uncharacterized phage-like protein YoqJ
MKTNKNIAVVGTRNFTDKNTFKRIINEVITIEGIPNKIVSGGAIGADTLAFEWAIENSTEILVFKPRYEDFPKKKRWMAPKERNTTIVDNSDIVLAFWDMESTGTKDTINKSIKKGKKIYLYNIKENKVSLIGDEIV